MKITIYTDGSSRGNPGPGGWGSILITDTEVIELGGYEGHTTNNRMELTGAIKGLREIPDHRPETTDKPKIEEVEVCTDSEYVKKGMTEWIKGWMARGWKTSTKKPVLNQDLWEELHAEEKRLKDAGAKVVWTYVPGHAGVPLNERADEIATACADSVIDKGLPAASAAQAGQSARTSRAQAGATNLQLYRGPKDEYEHH